MKQTPLIFAALVFAAAAQAQPQPDLIARIHFAGAKQISADTNHLAFTNEFCSAEARALESQTLDKLSRVPGAWFKSKIAPGAGDCAEQLRPLLGDLLKSEWLFEMRDTTNGSPEYALAVRLSPERAQLWSDNLVAVFQDWMGVAISQDKAGNWEFRKHQPPDLFQFSRSDDWVVIDCGQNELSLGREMLQNAAANNGWLSVNADWPRLAQLFPALKEFDFPKIQMQVAGRDGNFRLTGRLALARPLPPVEPWRVPTNTIRQPFNSFTAARGVAPWLQKQGWARPFFIRPQPDQLFIWAQSNIPFQTFAAEPVPDAKAALAQLDRQMSGNTNWQRYFINPLTLMTTNDEISLLGLPFIVPLVQAVHERAGDFLVGGFFPNGGRSRPMPPALLARLSQPGLVYYHWEITAERLNELPQLSQLLFVFTGHQQLDGQSTAAKWLNLIGPKLGNSDTEVTQTAPDELAFQRTAPGGLTAIELLLFANWLESPQFPAFDLRMPPPTPHIRHGQKPLKVLSAPPVAPVPP